MDNLYNYIKKDKNYKNILNLFNYEINNTNDLFQYFFSINNISRSNKINYKKTKYNNVRKKSDIKCKYYDLDKTFLINKKTNYEILQLIFDNTTRVKKEILRIFIIKYFNINNYKNYIYYNNILLSNIFNFDNIKVKNSVFIDNYDLYLFSYFNHYNEIELLDLLKDYIVLKSFTEIGKKYNKSITKAKEDIYKSIQMVIDYLETDLGIISIQDVLLNNDNIILPYKLYLDIINYVIYKTIFGKFYRIVS